jgi:quinol monooxygenase YgiN
MRSSQFRLKHYEMSKRNKRVMVKTNCAALPATLIESELFGREKGAVIERIKISELPGGKQQLGKALASLTGPTSVLPGCLSCSVLQTYQDSNELLVETDWESKEDLVRHLQSDTYKQLLLLMELGPKPPVIQFFTVIELRGLDLVEAAREPGHKFTPEQDFESNN